MFLNKHIKIFAALSSVTQTALCLVVPAGLCIGVGKWLVDKQGFPQFTIIIAIVFGVISGFYTMIKYIYELIKSQK